MKVVFSPQAKEQLAKLPKHLRKKAHKQFGYLLLSFRHPSLRSRKMSGTDIFEARIDVHYIFSFIVEGEEIWVLTVGPHDVGLGKK